MTIGESMLPEFDQEMQSGFDGSVGLIKDAGIFGSGATLVL